MEPTPVIIPCGEHSITLDMIDNDALLVLRKLNKAGFSSYLVGGGVRDLLLGKTPKDFDISTNARPGQVRRLFTNSRTIGRRFRLVQIFFKHNKIIEVSTLRSLSEHDLDGPEAVLAPNNTYGSLDEDAQRRDLSINALFYEIENQTIIDYVGGTADLDRSLVRIIGDPDKRINRDPVRILRVLRHSARNNFSIEDSSWQAICRQHAKLSLCPPSRLRDELFKDLYGGFAEQWFKLAINSGVFSTLFPLYQELLDKPLPDGVTCANRLGALLRTIDHITAELYFGDSSRPPDFFVLACLLIPWATLQFGLFDTHLKGPQAFQRAKRIREELNATIGPELNLRRSTRQEIATLLTHLPIFTHLQNGKSWPKWLRRKSYFASCRLLHHVHRQAIDGEEIPPALLQVKAHASPRKHDKRRTRRSRGGRGRPALSGKRGGGIFGFKR